MDDEVGIGHKLMGAARMLAGAVSDLLRSVEPAAAEVRLSVWAWTSLQYPTSHKGFYTLKLHAFPFIRVLVNIHYSLPSIY